jgi:predicted MFS family arabinose efflux permease
MSSPPKAAATNARHRLSLMLAVCVGSGLAHLGTSTLPLQIGAVIDGSHHTASEAGLFGFFQSVALAAGMAVISSWVDRLAPRKIAWAGCLLAIIANLGLYSATHLSVQLALAAAAGLGYGCVFAATVASAAAAADPDRAYAIGNGGALLLISGLISLLPAVTSHLGPTSIFATFAILAAACSPAFLAFERPGRATHTQLAAWRIPGARGLLFAWVAYSGGTGALYAFSERIGTNIGLTSSQIALVLSAGLFVGLFGTLAAALMGGRVNRPWALTVGMTGSGLSCLALGYANSLTSFAADVFAYWIFCMFLYSYLLGTAAVLDPQGRVGTLGGGLEKLGVGVGVYLAGVVAQSSTYSSTGALGFSSCLVGLILGFPSVFRALKAATDASLPPPPITHLSQ